MADLLSLFRGTKPGATSPRTTPTTPLAPEADKPERSGGAASISNGTAYEVVVPVPSPVLGAIPPTMFNPGTAGNWGEAGMDATGWYFTDEISTATSRPPPAGIPATFFVLQATTTPKVTADGVLADRLYRAFTKARD